MGEFGFAPESEMKISYPEFKIQGGKTEFIDPEAQVNTFGELKTQVEKNLSASN